jgi:IMP cyclohydrolase-like protein.
LIRAKWSDPSLIIYNPVRTLGKKIIVTNGDQTDTIYDGMRCGGTFEGALRTRAFEPDAPNFTPRISLLADFTHGYKASFSILKAADANGERCLRCFYEYEGFDAGEGRFIHTYKQDGNPIPSFEGEPEVISIDGDEQTLTEALWNALDENNKVSLWTMIVDLRTGEKKTTIINRNA